MPEPTSPRSPDRPSDSRPGPSRPRRASAPPNRTLGSLRRSQRRRQAAETEPTGHAAPAVATARPTEADPATDSTDVEETPARPERGRLWNALFRPGKGQIIAAVILFVVGMGGVMQIRINNADDAYTNARREDLIQLLDGLGSESRRLESEITELEQTRTNLQSGADTQRVAQEEAQKRVTELSILAGTAPAVGPGIRLRIADPNGKLDENVILDAVEEMRDAGGEVIEVNNTIRVVASTWFGSDANGLVIDGKPVSTPVTLEVIGDPHSLEEAARFRGGLVSEITGPRIGGQVQIDQLDRVVIESLHTPVENQYAQPASPPPTPR